MKKLLQNKKSLVVTVMMVGILALAITSKEKTFLGNDGITDGLIWNSEFLVYGPMTMNYQRGAEFAYGLGEMFPFSKASFEDALTDESLGFEFGYSTEDKVIAVIDCESTRQIFTVGSILTFMNGDKAEVICVTPSEDGYLYIRYEADEIYSFHEQDNLRYLTIYEPALERYRIVGQIVPYESQIGLQGKIFGTFPIEYTLNEMVEIYQWILAFLYATIIAFICYEIYVKYNGVFAVVYYMITLLSPWMIGYSTNLYWVSFTWFLPMLVGLFCSNHIYSRKARWIAYISVMLAIALKCACGYEFITTIMLSSIVFLLADFLTALLEKRDRKDVWLLFRTIFFMGVFALIGFAIAITIHAYMRGSGDIANGLKSIYYTDVLRRTLGGSVEGFQDIYSDSLSASVLYVLARYLLFDTPIIMGIPGVLFIPLIVLSFVALVYGVRRGLVCKNVMILYFCAGIASVSWFVLGKSHSYVHTFMNFVLWYFGFVQIAFYGIIQILICVWNERKKKNEELN